MTDRLSNGKIKEKYKLRLKNYETKNLSAQLSLLEEQNNYIKKSR